MPSHHPERSTVRCPPTPPKRTVRSARPGDSGQPRISADPAALFAPGTATHWPPPSTGASGWTRLPRAGTVSTGASQRRPYLLPPLAARGTFRDPRSSLPRVRPPAGRPSPLLSALSSSRSAIGDSRSPRQPIFFRSPPRYLLPSRSNSLLRSTAAGPRPLPTAPPPNAVPLAPPGPGPPRPARRHHPPPGSAVAGPARRAAAATVTLRCVGAAGGNRSCRRWWSMRAARI